MTATWKEMIEYFRAVGANTVEHTQGTYVGHAISVYRDLEKWGADKDVCCAGLFHSIYGTELFQGFTLPVEKRHEIAALIGQRGERLAYWNCLMDRASFDALLQHSGPAYVLTNRVTGESMELNEDEYNDLCTVHLCDWIEQAPRTTAPNYRENSYRGIAQRLGGVALESYQRQFGAAEA